MEDGGMNPREAEKNPPQVEMLPALLPKKGKQQGERIQFFFLPISLRSWFSDFKCLT